MSNKKVQKKLDFPEKHCRFDKKRVLLHTNLTDKTLFLCRWNKPLAKIE